MVARSRVVVDCSRPFTGDPDRAETLTEITLEALAAVLAGDSETAKKCLITREEVARLPTVDEAIERLPSVAS